MSGCTQCWQSSVMCAGRHKRALLELTSLTLCSVQLPLIAGCHLLPHREEMVGVSMYSCVPPHSCVTSLYNPKAHSTSRTSGLCEGIFKRYFFCPVSKFQHHRIDLTELLALVIYVAFACVAVRNGTFIASKCLSPHQCHEGQPPAGHDALLCS